MKTQFEIVTRPRSQRTGAEKFRESYAMLRVCLSRLMRGDKPRLRTLMFK